MFHFPARAGAPSNMFTSRAGTRFYTLLGAQEQKGQARGLILLLHGCGQRAERFAAETGLGDKAARLGWITLAPQQSRRKNVLGCWNWFDPAHRARKGGEVEILAAMAQEVAVEHGVPPGMIFVAGFSAGAAMALALADAYPEVFAAVVAHSGVYYAGIRSGDAAAAAMRGDFTDAAPGPHKAGVPVLVVQGSADPVVHPENAQRIAQAVGGRVVMVRGKGHEWVAGATDQMIAFFREQAATAPARYPA